ncbi:uncharacterized protein KGF55_001723 [Candida pseudojiufengensis]|uniref:uncharacterized protein n=1 Tax=Candida pseudojiufengensis TaxID=497109 RepID=UPI00222531C4|nr:uncharacterized protein KGF55_001723 [Candida pseudojiufengensis]KAI5964654.1 hypothetical protein KGF55_001723 [Candida pseudojiufengensis]
MSSTQITEKTPKLQHHQEPKLPVYNSIYDFKYKDLLNNIIDFVNFKNKVIICCNTALLCGFTIQLLELQQLYDKYKSNGLVIIGFPCNQFGNQEPNDEITITKQSKKDYGVTFPIMKKIKVNGENEDDIYKYLKNQKSGMFGFKGVRWNFEKFIIDKRGKVVARFDSWITPLQFENYIKQLLDESVEEKPIENNSKEKESVEDETKKQESTENETKKQESI